MENKILLTWEHTRNKQGAKLNFEENAEIPKGTRKKINSLISKAGFSGHVVVCSNSLSTNQKNIFILKWNHFTWPEVYSAIESAIKMQFPNATFKKEE